MTDPFTQLKEAAKAQVATEEAKVKGWWATNWKEVGFWLALVAVGVLIGHFA